ncbi:2-phospho-L-lactate guanylyltransferase [Microbacterium gorillae]|uniref:2-phospho-L-lactate guanylyltransferase n=1 Tax=Microbacterium gorillae TaxID=1231063 RepID=UPI000590C4C6|nr:2-phospho-L-lactate guanylyltransferase [Microbacterium gorillae]
MSEPVWTVVVPVKHTDHGKSRIAGPPSLARAIALDTIEAVHAAGGVGTIVVVTSDADLADAARSLGAVIVPEPAAAERSADPDLDAPLNAAVTGALQGVTGPVAVLHADLPALVPEDLARLLVTARGVRFGAVADLAGTGTTVLTAQDPADVVARFGPGSFARHLASGAEALDAPTSIRHDVDTPADLTAVLSSPALGRRTRAHAL